MRLRVAARLPFLCSPVARKEARQSAPSRLASLVVPVALLVLSVLLGQPTVTVFVPPTADTVLVPRPMPSYGPVAGRLGRPTMPVAAGAAPFVRDSARLAYIGLEFCRKPDKTKNGVYS